MIPGDGYNEWMPAYGAAALLSGQTCPRQDRPVAVLFHQIGPYHWARLNAAGKLTSVLCIEFSRQTSAYGWGEVTERGRFARETLCPEGNSWALPPREVAARVNQVLARHQPRCVFIHGWSDPGALAALNWCIRTNTRRVVMSESSALDGPRKVWREWLKSRIVQCFDGGFAGGSLHSAYLQSLGMPSSRIRSGYDVVDNDYFFAGATRARAEAARFRRELGLPERYFIASKRFIPKKNLTGLMRAYTQYRARAGERAWDLVILGDGPLREQLLRERERLNLGASVHFPGFRSYAELPAYYGLAGALVHTSTIEQWGLVVNEAMASGLPVLVSNHCGCAPDLVRNGENGYTFDPHDPEALVARMLQVSASDAQREVMGRASLEIIVKWSPQTFACAIRSLAAQLDNESSRNVPSLLDQWLVQILLRRRFQNPEAA
jgi:1,2-diacylglycerol 3-alpha-glucosyltransferase